VRAGAGGQLRLLCGPTKRSGGGPRSLCSHPRPRCQGQTLAWNDPGPSQFPIDHGAVSSLHWSGSGCIYRAPAPLIVPAAGRRESETRREPGVLVSPALRAHLRRRRRRSYQPRATPWVSPTKTIRSAESAIHPASIPNIAFIEFHIVFLKQIAILLLEGLRAMMLLLAFYVEPVPKAPIPDLCRNLRRQLCRKRPNSTKVATKVTTKVTTKSPVRRAFGTGSTYPTAGGRPPRTAQDPLAVPRARSNSSLGA